MARQQQQRTAENKHHRRHKIESDMEEQRANKDQHDDQSLDIEAGAIDEAVVFGGAMNSLTTKRAAAGRNFKYSNTSNRAEPGCAHQVSA